MQKQQDSPLQTAELQLTIILKQYQNLHNQLAVKTKLGYDNNQHILSLFVKVASTSFKPIELLLRFLSDQELLCMASTCQTLHQFFYSPLGFRLLRSLRPVVVKVKREGEMPVYNRPFLENLCQDVSLVNMDEDDKIAITETMKTNLMAARQKVREIELCSQEWDLKKSQKKTKMMEWALRKETQSHEIQVIIQQKEKLFELLSESSFNIERLKEYQGKMLEQRAQKKTELEIERSKLARQKELLIKKIKAQQKEREEVLLYAREVQRVTLMLTKLTQQQQLKRS